MSHKQPPVQDDRHNPGVHHPLCLSRGTRVGEDQIDFSSIEFCTCHLRGKYINLDTDRLGEQPEGVRREVHAALAIALELV